jgi:hypothetical protein
MRGRRGADPRCSSSILIRRGRRKIKLTQDELEFLSAWTRAEREPACYGMPAHRLQLAHAVVGAQLIVFVKAWTEDEGKKDEEILAVAVNPQPRWPWSTTGEFAGRLAEASIRLTIWTE